MIFRTFGRLRRPLSVPKPSACVREAQKYRHVSRGGARESQRSPSRSLGPGRRRRPGGLGRVAAARHAGRHPGQLLGRRPRPPTGSSQVVSGGEAAPRSRPTPPTGTPAPAVLSVQPDQAVHALGHRRRERPAALAAVGARPDDVRVGVVGHPGRGRHRRGRRLRRGGRPPGSRRFGASGHRLRRTRAATAASTPTVTARTSPASSPPTSTTALGIAGAAPAVQDPPGARARRERRRHRLERRQGDHLGHRSRRARHQPESRRRCVAGHPAGDAVREQQGCRGVRRRPATTARPATNRCIRPRTPKPIAVAAVDSNLTHPAFGNTGSYIDVAAPGDRHLLDVRARRRPRTPTRAARRWRRRTRPPRPR